MDAVGATAYADAPVGLLSGGEQQRLRIAQALLGDPRVLLCDEPLLALDLASQRAVTELIDQRRRSAGTPVVFVTHEVNPVLPYVDRILYLVRGRWAIGTPSEILTSERLTALYGIPVDVLKVRDRFIVLSAEHDPSTEPGSHAHHIRTPGSRADGHRLLPPVRVRPARPRGGVPGRGDLRAHRALCHQPLHGLRRARHQRTRLHRRRGRAAGGRQPAGGGAGRGAGRGRTDRDMGRRPSERDSSIGVISGRRPRPGRLSCSASTTAMPARP